ncbi:MAG: right-handed parallel beta-helix repeat-containing protein, partial [Bacteroidota bacterium]
MKKNYLSTLFFLGSLFPPLLVWGQLYTESFENANNCPPDPDCIIVIDDNNCLPGWSTSHGSAFVEEMAPGAFAGDNVLDLSYANLNGPTGAPLLTDGVFLSEVDFEAGQCYTISFWYRVGNTFGLPRKPVELSVYLANNLTHNDPSGPTCWEVPPNPGVTDMVFSETIGVNYNGPFTYQQALTTITATDDYDFLWLLLEGDNAFNSIAAPSIAIDQLEIFSCEFSCTCEQNPIQIGGLDASGAELEVEVSDFEFPGGVMPPACYEVQGTLIIDENTSVQDALFRMAPGSEIIVKNGVTFDVTASRFNGCAFLWDGITVEPGGTLLFVNNRISDALHAIDVVGGSTLELKQTTFTNNHIGLYAHEGTITQIENLDGNIFQGMDNTPLLPPNQDQVNFLFPVGVASFAGVLLYKTSGFTIGVKGNASIVNNF